MSGGKGFLSRIKSKSTRYSYDRASPSRVFNMMFLSSTYHWNISRSCVRMKIPKIPRSKIPFIFRSRELGEQSIAEERETIRFQFLLSFLFAIVDYAEYDRGVCYRIQRLCYFRCQMYPVYRYVFDTISIVSSLPQASSGVRFARLVYTRERTEGRKGERVFKRVTYLMC